MLDIFASFVTFSQFYTKYFNLPAREKFCLVYWKNVELSELFGNCINAKVLAFLVLDLCWMEVPHVHFDSNLPLPQVE